MILWLRGSLDSPGLFQETGQSLARDDTICAVAEIVGSLGITGVV